MVQIQMLLRVLGSPRQVILMLYTTVVPSYKPH